MALVKMAAAARKAHVGSTKTIQKALRAAGIALTEIAPGSFAVDEEDLERYLLSRQDRQPEISVKPAAKHKKPKVDRRR